MDEIFDNLYILIPVAVVVALRILGARKKHSAAQAAPGEEDRGAAEPVSPGSGGNGLPHWLVPEENDPPPVKKKAPPPPPPPPPLQETFLPPEPALFSEEAALPDRRFPANLKYLSPLKQAAVFAEILGPPRSLGPV